MAAKLKVSSALVYKWCQPPPTRESPDSSGARNPLDRVRVILDATGDTDVVRWLCQAAGGFFAPNPKVEPGRQDEELLAATHRVVGNFSDILTKISRSIEDDGQITPDEADVIRQSWEHLKSQGECFVQACERGMYMRQPDQRTG